MPRRPPEIQVDVVFRLGQCDKEKHGWRGGLPLVLTARIAPATGLHPHGELMVERKKNTAICWQPARFAVPLSICAILALCLAVGLPPVFPRQWFLGDDFGLLKHLHGLPFQRLLSSFRSAWTAPIYW